MFSYQGSFKKRQASEARRQDHPTCRAPLQNKSFFHESPVERPDQASHGWAWPEPAPHPRHGREDAASAAPSLPCSQLSQGERCFGVRLEWIPWNPQAPRASGCGDASCGVCTTVQGFSNPLSPTTDIPHGDQTCALLRGLGAASFLRRCPLHLRCPSNPPGLRQAAAEIKINKEMWKERPETNGFVLSVAGRGESDDRQRRKSLGS